MARTSRGQEAVDVRTLLDDLEETIEAVRLGYEKYFTGVDKVAPVRTRERLDTKLRNLQSLHMRSTALRFRLAGLRARYVTYKHYWTRVEGEIERGVSRRDLNYRRRAARSSPAATIEPLAPPLPPPVPVPAAADKRKSTRVDTDLDPSHLKEVFRDLVKAKKAAGEDTKGLTYAALVRKLSREAPKVRAKHGCEKVRFEVRTIKGKVRVRARPD